MIKKYWPVLWIVVFWFVLAHPYFLKGLVPFPSTYLVDFFSPWNNYFGMPVKNNAMPDVLTQIYPWKKVVIDSWKAGQIPFWNPYQFAGNPHLANFQSAVFTPFNLLFFILPFVDAWSILILLQPLLAGLFMYLYARQISISQTGSVISSVSFMFMGFITVWMAYGTLGYAILYLPLLLYGIERYYKKADKLSAAIVVFSVPLSFFSGHFQTSLYFLLAGILYILFKFFTTRNSKLLITNYKLLITGLILSLPQILPSIRFYQQSIRSELFQKGEVIPWNYIATTIAPDFFGNPVTRNDWFGHYAEWASYAGVMPLMLAVLSLFYIRKKRQIVFFALLGLLSVVLAYDSPIITGIVSLKIPVLSTSAASRIIVLFSFSIAVLSGIGFDYLNKKKHIYYFLTWLAVAGVLWALLFSGNLFLIEGSNPDSYKVAQRNFVLPTLMIIFGFGYVISHIILDKFVKHKALRRKLLLITHFTLLITISFDMLRFTTKWMPFDDRKFVYPQLEALVYLKTYSGSERVFGNFGNEAQATFGIQSIEGYDPLYIQRYGEFLTASTDGKIGKTQRSVVRINKNGEHTKKILDLLGVRYLLHSKGDGRNIWAFPYWNYLESFNVAVWSDEKYEIYKNSDAYSRAFLVYDYKVAKQDQEIIDLMFDENTDLSKTVILEDIPNYTNLTIEQFNNLTIINKTEITKYTPNEVVIEVQSNHPALLFLSDNHYPGWNAYVYTEGTQRVDGEKAKIYRANYTFRAVEIPKGNSTVIFKYENWYF